MKTQSVALHKQRLDNIFKLVEALPPDTDMELRSHLARYLCVLTSGFLEQSVRAILVEHAKNRSATEVRNYVEAKLGDFQNAKMERIIALLFSFNGQWAEDVRAATEGELQEAVDSVVNTRHRIAHGVNAGMTYVTIKRYYASIVKTLEILEARCLL